MTLANLADLSRRDLIRTSVLVGVLVVVILWATLQFLQPAAPRHLVMASGVEGGLYYRYALRYAEILARDGVVVEVRKTAGAAENQSLLLDPRAGVDVAFLQGGVATFPAADNLVMLASLYFEPLWVFYRGEDALTQLNHLQGKRITIGTPGSGTRAFIEPLLAANGLSPENITMLGLSGGDALRALRTGEADAALMVGGGLTPVIIDALRDPTLNLMNFARADAYVRRFPYITKVTLPAGTVDLAREVPREDAMLIATEALLGARTDVHPALVSLLVDAAREIHSTQSYFETAGEFPNTTRVDLPVSTDAIHHIRFGPSFLHRLLPFWVANFIEKAIIVMLPLVVIIVPLINFLPQVLRWRIRSRIYRWYGELALLERDVASRQGPPPIDQWLQTLDRIRRAVEQIHTPPSFASEAYTLREHIALVHRAVLAKADGVAPPV